VGEGLRKFLLTLWNTYSFFVTYALIDGFDPRGQAQGERPLLDRWVLSELNALVNRVSHYMDNYNPTDAGRAIQAFVDDLSNWYVRLNRRRFWKSESDADKLAAHQTLYTCLVTVAKLLAPFTPFVAEEMYQNLVCSSFPEEPESVHLARWPQADTSLVDEELMADQKVAMRFSRLILAARSKGGIPVRQPLGTVYLEARDKWEDASLRRVVATVLQNTNVQSSTFSELETWIKPVEADEAGSVVKVETHVTDELRADWLARELVRRLQTMRKNAGFDIADRIVTYYQGSEDLCRIMKEHADYVRQETLSRELVAGPPPAGAHAEEQKIAGQAITLAVERRP
jgi:isoleucyl-tRNA synthetase